MHPRPGDEAFAKLAEPARLHRIQQEDQREPPEATQTLETEWELLAYVEQVRDSARNKESYRCPDQSPETRWERWEWPPCTQQWLCPACPTTDVQS